MEEWEEESRSRRRGLSGRRDRGGALAVRELAGEEEEEEEEAMDNYEDQNIRQDDKKKTSSE